MFAQTACKNTAGPSTDPIDDPETEYEITLGLIINGMEGSVTVDLTKAYPGTTVTVTAEKSIEIEGTEHGLLWLKANNHKLPLAVHGTKYISSYEMPERDVVIKGEYNNLAQMDIESILSLMST